MPLEIKQDLIDELINREMMKERFAPRPEPTQQPQGELNPTLLALLGAGADAASTYKFLKTGEGVEDNPAHAGKGPAGTAFSVLQGNLGELLLARVLAKKFPKLGDTLTGQFGARGIGLAGANLDGLRESSHKQINTALTKNIQKRRK